MTTKEITISWRSECHCVPSSSEMQAFEDHFSIMDHRDRSNSPKPMHRHNVSAKRDFSSVTFSAHNKCSEHTRDHIIAKKAHSSSCVTFCDEVLVKTIPGCLDFLDLEDDIIGGEALEQRRQTMHLSSSSSSAPPYFVNTSYHYQTMPRPVPQRPLHPRLLKVRCSTWDPVARPVTPFNTS